MMKSTIDLKIIYNGIMKRRKLPSSFKELRNLVSNELYDFLPFDQFNLFYIDNEGDKICLSTEEDFCHAKQFNEINTFKIFVEKKNTENNGYEMVEKINSPEDFKLPSEIQKSEILSINDSEIIKKKNSFAKIVEKKFKKIEKSINKIDTKINENVSSINKDSNLEHIEDVVTLLKKNISEFVNEKFDKLKNKIISKACKFTDKEVRKAISNIVHKVGCDGCKKSTINGILYKCAVCKNFNFCAECEEKNNEHLHHPFLKLRNSQQVEVTSLSINNKQFGQINVENGNVYVNQYKDAISSFIEIGNPIYNSKCLSQNLEIKINHKMKNLKKQIKLLNTGSISWPVPSHLVNLKEESSLLGKNIRIRRQVDSGKEAEVEIIFNTENVKEGNYKSVWQLCDDKRLPIGDKIVFNFNVNFSNEIIINSDFIQIGREIFINKEVKAKSLAELLKIKSESKPQSKFMKLVQEMKTNFGVTGVDDKLILNAIVMSEGNMQVAYERIKTMKNTLNYRSKYYL